MFAIKSNVVYCCVCGVEMNSKAKEKANRIWNHKTSLKDDKVFNKAIDIAISEAKKEVFEDIDGELIELCCNAGTLEGATNIKPTVEGFVEALGSRLGKLAKKHGVKLG